jgi:3-oxoacyl-(acyl-carrier-protein) synthase
MGPNYSISTACATANYAFVAAAMHLRNGDCDVLLVGGTEAPIIPVGLGGFVACRCVSALSLSGSLTLHTSAEAEEIQVFSIGV